MTMSLVTVPTKTGQRIEDRTGRLVGSVDYCFQSNRFETFHAATRNSGTFRTLEAAGYWMLAEELEHQANLTAVINELVA